MPRHFALALSALTSIGCTNDGLLLESRQAAAPDGFQVLIPRAASAFADSVGFSFGVSGGADVATLRAALLELQVRHARAFAFAPGSATLQRVADVTANGIGLQLIADPRLDGVAGALPALIEQLPQLESVEGPNDFDAYGTDLSVAQIRSTMLELRQDLDAASRGLPLVDGLDSLATGVGDLSDIVDYGSFERLRDTQLPGRSLDADKQRARTIAGSRPLFVTECGYSTLAGGSGSVSEEAAARYLPRLLLAHFAQGVERTYIDELSDGSTPTRTVNSQGVIRADGTHKAAFLPLKRLLLHTLDAGPAFAATPFEVTLDGVVDSLRQVLLERSDGTHVMALWNEVASFDPKAGITLAPEPLTVTVRLPAPASYQVFRPLLADEAIATGLAQAIRLSVADDVSLLEVAPASAP